jgi:NADPH-dependent 2,4-dienoyl-CoA reductase/sulfur reductase-like enzyme
MRPYWIGHVVVALIGLSVVYELGTVARVRGVGNYPRSERHAPRPVPPVLELDPSQTIGHHRPGRMKPRAHLLQMRKVEITEAALVVGGGVAGIQAALDLADSGTHVYLVERQPSIGGHMAMFDG